MTAAGERSLASCAARSLAGHGAVLALGLLASRLPALLGGGARELNVRLVEGSARVDVTGMPRLTPAELRRLPRVRQRAADTAALPAPAQGPAGAADLASLLRDLSRGRTERPPAPRRRRAAPAPVGGEALADLVLAGNRLSEGQGLAGARAGGEARALDAWLASLPDLVREHWSLPAYLRDLGLQCRIRIYVDERGVLTRALVHESSGNEEYDAIALEAVRRTDFPVPDPSIARELAEGRVLLGLPL